ncbi:hypothetical protein EDB86DRAFT_2873026 [Lactarius hatsudake]|nr:hypothetical protein EDB86DRAFT_2873026 [Lactarius hatsudake]
MHSQAPPSLSIRKPMSRRRLLPITLILQSGEHVNAFICLRTTNFTNFCVFTGFRNYSESWLNPLIPTLTMVHRLLEAYEPIQLDNGISGVSCGSQRSIDVCPRKHIQPEPERSDRFIKASH